MLTGRVRAELLAAKRRLHFVGAGGAGMSGIAELCARLGFEVSGCDLKQNAAVTRLANLGVKMSVGHDPRHVEGELSAVVYSSAVARDNPELLRAQELRVPVIPRAEMLGELLRLARVGIAVAGAHGKTTTTSLIASILEVAGYDPTAVVGGNFRNSGTNVRLGANDYMVVEADESDSSFLLLTPTVAVVTNIDREHLDHYGSMENLRQAFLNFMNRVPFYGFVVVCADDPEIQRLSGSLHKRVITTGLGADSVLQARAIEINGTRTSFEVFEHGRRLGRLEVPLPGVHEVRDALAALATARQLGIDFATAAAALKEFPGVTRRFDVRGEARGRLIIDDYAHHPAEVRATLAAARDGFRRRIIAVFQPHRYTRMRDLFADFVTAFDDADVLFITDIYGAGEKPLPGLSARKLADAIGARGRLEVHYLGLEPCGNCDAVGLSDRQLHGGDLKPLADTIIAASRPEDLIITMGAGDISQLCEPLLAALESGGRVEEAGAAHERS